MNIDKYITELKKQEAELLEGLVTQPSSSLEKYHAVVGKIHGLRDAIATLLQQISDE